MNVAVEKKKNAIAEDKLSKLREPSVVYLEMIEREVVQVPDGGGTIKRAVDDLAADRLTVYNDRMDGVPRKLKAAFSTIRKIGMDVPAENFTVNDRIALVELKDAIDSAMKYAKKNKADTNKLEISAKRLESTLDTLKKSGLMKAIGDAFGK